MYIRLDEAELDGLRGLDHSLWVLYMHLKQFMDYETGVVGYARRISYQSISEALYIEPRQGVKGGSPHISAIRRMIDQLIKHAVIRKSRKDTLVFKLHLADINNNVQNKADKKPTLKDDTSKASKEKDYSENADIHKTAKADIPHLSLNTINKTPSTKLSNSVEAGKVNADVDGENLIFHKSLHADVTASMQKQLEGFTHERQQEIIDELSFYINKNKINVSPMSLFMAMVKGAKAGTFIAANASSIKRARQAVKASAMEKPKAEPTAEQREATKEKGRAAMSNVKQLFNKKGAIA